MLNGKKVVVVMPAYNTERTLELTAADIPKNVADAIIVVDDGSRDRTSSAVGAPHVSAENDEPGQSRRLVCAGAGAHNARDG